MLLPINFSRAIWPYQRLNHHLPNSPSFHLWPNLKSRLLNWLITECGSQLDIIILYDRPTNATATTLVHLLKIACMGLQQWRIALQIQLYYPVVLLKLLNVVLIRVEGGNCRESLKTQVEIYLLSVQHDISTNICNQHCRHTIWKKKKKWLSWQNVSDNKIQISLSSDTEARCLV